ncbi:uncharacterized protein LOC106163836 [Lingula anatina]|uniref:Uncharacterized protein LOC106163836 n=1 Tax=Lingula anatina TaxID=7574 RepID=A0A1S3IGI7_LINAN|nr:uncharacterized protein LOC106163836 [Lingula anatina]|eukprot:XP_013396981.1 uncharacterized protein LOC106163836 [Lingula anatina]
MNDQNQYKRDVATHPSSYADENGDSEKIAFQCNAGANALQSLELHNDNNDNDCTDSLQTAPGTKGAWKNKQGINPVSICQKHDPVNPEKGCETGDQRENSCNNTPCQEGVLTFPLMKGYAAAETSDPPPVPARTYQKIITPVTPQTTSVLPPGLPTKQLTRGFHNTGLKDGQEIEEIAPTGIDLNGCFIPPDENRRHSLCMSSCYDVLNQVNSDLIEADYCSEAWPDPLHKAGTQTSCPDQNNSGCGPSGWKKVEKLKVEDAEEKWGVSPPVPQRTYKHRSGEHLLSDAPRSFTPLTSTRQRSASVGNLSKINRFSEQGRKRASSPRDKPLPPAPQVERTYKRLVGFSGEGVPGSNSCVSAFLGAALNTCRKYPSDSHIYHSGVKAAIEPTPNVTCVEEFLEHTHAKTSSQAHQTPAFSIPSILIEPADGGDIAYVGVERIDLIEDDKHPPFDKIETKKESKAIKSIFNVPRVPERTYKQVLSLPGSRARSSSFGSFGMHHRKGARDQDLHVHFSLDTRDLDSKETIEKNDNVAFRRHSFTAPTMSQLVSKNAPLQRTSSSPTEKVSNDEPLSPRQRSSSFSDYVKRLISPGPDAVRMKERLQATMAGVEELHILREKQRLAVEEAKMIGKAGRQRSNTFDPSELHAKRRQVKEQRTSAAERQPTSMAPEKSGMYLHPQDALKSASNIVDWNDDGTPNTMGRDRSSTWSGVPQPPTPPRVRRLSGRRRHDSGGKHKHRRDSNANKQTHSEVKDPSAPHSSQTKDNLTTMKNPQEVETAHSKLDKLMHDFPEPFMRPRTFSGGDFKFPSPMHAVLLQCENSGEVSNPAMHFQFSRSNSVGRVADIRKDPTRGTKERNEPRMPPAGVSPTAHSSLNVKDGLRDATTTLVKSNARENGSNKSENDSCRFQASSGNSTSPNFASTDKVVRNVISVAHTRRIPLKSRDSSEIVTYSDKQNRNNVTGKSPKEVTKTSESKEQYQAEVLSNTSRFAGERGDQDNGIARLASSSLNADITPNKDISLLQCSDSRPHISKKNHKSTPVSKITTEKAIAELDRNIQELAIADSESLKGKESQIQTSPPVHALHGEICFASNQYPRLHASSARYLGEHRKQKPSAPVIRIENGNRPVHLNININVQNTDARNHPRHSKSNDVYPAHVLGSFAEEEEINDDNESANPPEPSLLVTSSPRRSQDGIFSVSLEEGYFSEPGTPRHSLASNFSEISHYTTSSCLSSMGSDGEKE